MYHHLKIRILCSCFFRMNPLCLQWQDILFHGLRHIVLHVSTVAQNGDTKYQLLRKPFFVIFAATVSSLTCLESEDEQRDIQFAAIFNLTAR